MSIIFNLLKTHKISYIVLTGKYDEESYYIKKTSIKKDLDILLDSTKENIIHHIFNHKNLKHLEDNSFFDTFKNLRIDIYFRSLNVGYYHYFKADTSVFSYSQYNENVYVIYLILDPLLKFSKYHIRHQYRLKMYFKNGINDEISLLLSDIIGVRLASYLLKKISQSDFKLSKIFIRLCKIKMLFINGNFVRMFKSRILHESYL